MKYFIAILFIANAFAGAGVKIKGKLLSFDEKHFQIREGREVYKLPLGAFPDEKREKISKLVGKEVEVTVNFDDVKQDKK